MRTTYLIKQHEKAIKVLEMSVKNHQKIEGLNRRFDDYIKAGNQAWVKFPFFDKQKLKIQILSAEYVERRLKEYYLKTIESITEKAIL